VGSCFQKQANRLEVETHNSFQFLKPGKSRDQRKPTGCATTRFFPSKHNSKKQCRAGNPADKGLGSGGSTINNQQQYEVI
jgi:hypothetical protein